MVKSTSYYLLPEGVGGGRFWEYHMVVRGVTENKEGMSRRLQNLTANAVAASEYLESLIRLGKFYRGKTKSIQLSSSFPPTPV